MKKIVFGFVALLALTACAPQQGDVSDLSASSSGAVILTKGAANAPVSIVEFADYQCPACKYFHDGVMPGLQREYIATGKVKFEFRDFPLIEVHPKTMLTHNAAWCANDQGKGDDMVEYLFAQQETISEDGIKNKAKELNLDVNTFNSCLAAGTHQKEIMANRNLGMSKGVNSTPTLYVNGKKIKGATDYPTFKAAIDKELESSVK